MTETQDENKEVGNNVHGIVSEYLSINPGKESVLAEVLRVSIPTIKRWHKGENTPHPLAARSVVSAIRKLLETQPK